LWLDCIWESRMWYRVMVMRMARLFFIVGLDKTGWKLYNKVCEWYELKHTPYPCDDGVYNDNQSTE
ncbi:hypothetical protein LCGC14_2713890, partial [marine sediment metagenome]